MVETLRLSFAYGASAGLVSVAAVCAGWALWPLRSRATLSALATDLVAQYALGLAIFSWLAAWAGLAGQMRLAAVAPLWTGAAAIGCGRAWLANRAPGPSLPRPARPRLENLGGKTGLFLAAAALALSVHILIGGLSPDMGHDTMWYHLSVPGQWAVTGRLDAFPLVFPSNYPLAQEALMAPLLLAGDDILCVSLCAQMALALMWTPVFLAYSRYGPRAGLWALAFFPLALAALFALAPVTVKNDRFAVLLLFAAMAILASRRCSRRTDAENADAIPSRDTLFAAFFLIGSAVAAKLIAIVFAGALAIVFVIQALRETRASRREAIGGVALAFAALILAYAPWGARGLMYSGAPFYPLASGLFPVRAEYQAGLDAMERLHALYPLTPAGVREALLQGTPGKIRHILLTRDVLFAIALTAAGWGVFSRKRWITLQAGAFLIGAAVFLLVRGHSETARFFTMGYGLTLGPVAWLFARLDRRLRGQRMRQIAVLAIWIGCAWTYGGRQRAFAGFETIQWRYRPRVTAEQVWAFARRAEKGEAFAGGRAVRAATPDDASIALVDGHYPFYMERRCLWSDEALGPLDDTLWRDWTPEAILAFLRDNAIEYVVATRHPPDERLTALEQVGHLAPTPLSSQAPPAWRMWRTRPIDQP